MRIALVVVERFKQKNKRKLQVLCLEIRLLKAESKDFKAGLKCKSRSQNEASPTCGVKSRIKSCETLCS